MLSMPARLTAILWLGKAPLELLCEISDTNNNESIELWSSIDWDFNV